MSILRTPIRKDEDAEKPSVRLRLALSPQDLADRVQADARAPGSRIRRPFVAPAEIERSPDMIKQRLAEEIEYAKRLINATGVELAMDTVCLVRHAGMLQRFDLIEQMLGHLANVAGATNPCDAIAAIGMQDLRNRLNRGAVNGGAPCREA